MANAPKSCLWELATFPAPDSDSQQDAKQLASNTGVLKNLFYFFSLIIFFCFSRVWLDNLECTLEKGWALNSCNGSKQLGFEQEQCSTPLKKILSLMNFSLGIPNESIAFILTSLACWPLPAKGDCCTLASLRCSASKLTCLPSTCVLL